MLANPKSLQKAFGNLLTHNQDFIDQMIKSIVGKLIEQSRIMKFKFSEHAVRDFVYSIVDRELVLTFPLIIREYIDFSVWDQYQQESEHLVISNHRN